MTCVKGHDYEKTFIHLLREIYLSFQGEN